MSREPVRRSSSPVPRVCPTLEKLQAIQGEWEWNGKLVRMRAEDGSGVLLALDTEGSCLNPLTVIAHGRKRASD